MQLLRARLCVRRRSLSGAGGAPDQAGGEGTFKFQDAGGDDGILGARSSGSARLGGVPGRHGRCFTLDQQGLFVAFLPFQGYILEPQSGLT